MRKEKKGRNKLLSLSTLRKLVTGKIVLIDTNIIIYLTDKVPPYEELSKLLFSLIEDGKTQGVISIISVGEVMQGLVKRKKPEIAIKVKEYLLNFPHLTCIGIDEEVLAYIGNDDRIDWSRLRTMDSLIIASGLKANVDKIISNDFHFKKSIAKDLLISFDT